jgi:hypothetical protein
MSSDSTDFEFHFPGLNYCGPGTDLDKRLEKDGTTPKPKYRPKDRIDEISLRHDLYYKDHPSPRERLVGDDIMLKELYEINNPTCRERCERCIVAPLLWLKRFIVKNWFSLIDIFQRV